MMRRATSVFGLLTATLLLAVAPAVHAQAHARDLGLEPEVTAIDARNRPAPEVSFGLYAKPNASSTMLSLHVGNAVMQSVQVYSEPSHTLLVAFADNSAADPRATEWYRALPPGGRMLMPLAPGHKGHFEADTPPASDDHVKIHVVAIFPGEETPREHVITGSVNPREFALRFRHTGSEAAICWDENENCLSGDS